MDDETRSCWLRDARLCGSHSAGSPSLGLALCKSQPMHLSLGQILWKSQTSLTALSPWQDRSVTAKYTVYVTRPMPQCTTTGDWGEWSPCEGNCGKGSQKRTRVVVPAFCAKAEEAKSTNHLTKSRGSRHREPHSDTTAAHTVP